MTNSTAGVTAETAVDCAINPTISIWNVVTIAGMTRTAAKLELTLADDSAGHSSAVQLEEDIDALILAASETDTFSTTDIFKIANRVNALRRYSITGSTADLRVSFGDSKLVLIANHDGIEEDATDTVALAA